MSDIHQDKPGLVRKALVLEWCLIAYNVLEAVVSIVFGYLAGSIALVGFGLDSVIEVSAAGILVWRLSQHGTIEEENEKEKKALYFVGITFCLLAAYILYESGSKLIHHEMPEKTMAGIVIATLSLLVMPVLGLKKRSLAKKMGSRALEADAVETLVCAYFGIDTPCPLWLVVG